MANKEIAKVEIDAAGLREKINEAGYSIRSIARHIDRSERQIRYYLERGKMPEGMLKQIDDVLYPKERKIWMRIGVTVPVTDDELYDIMQRNHQNCLDIYGKSCRQDRMDDYDLSEEESREFLKRAVADGESYIPEVCFDQHLEWWEAEKRYRNGIYNIRELWQMRENVIKEWEDNKENERV